MKGSLNRIPGLARMLNGALVIAAGAVLLSIGNAQAADAGVEAAGKNRYMDYCGVCHGADGKGGGPFAKMLNQQPSDLTVLSKNNGGTFPFDRVMETIDGRESVGGAHGTKEMPIWGGRWKGSSLGAETAVRGEILETIIYLRSIQQ